MRSTIPSAQTTLTTFLLAAASILTADILRAQNRDLSPPTDEADEAWKNVTAEPRLHQSFRACGKKWAKKAAKLSDESLAWMLQGKHGFYKVASGRIPILTLEILSTPNFKNCGVKTRWDERETTVRLTFYLPDGTTRTRQHNFANDDIYFNQPPKIYAQMGKALLLGVDVKGQPANRWLPLEPLQELARLARMEPNAEPTTVLAAAALGDAAPVVGFN